MFELGSEVVPFAADAAIAAISDAAFGSIATAAAAEPGTSWRPG